jgi:hypothetical protein
MDDNRYSFRPYQILHCGSDHKHHLSHHLLRKVAGHGQCNQLVRQDLGQQVLRPHPLIDFVLTLVPSKSTRNFALEIALWHADNRSRVLGRGGGKYAGPVLVGMQRVDESICEVCLLPPVMIVVGIKPTVQSNKHLDKGYTLRISVHTIQTHLFSPCCLSCWDHGHLSF